MSKLFRFGMLAAALGSISCHAEAAAPAPQYYAAYGYTNAALHTGTTNFEVGNLTQVDSNATFSAMATLGPTPLASAYVSTNGTASTQQANTGSDASAAVQYDVLVFASLATAEPVPLIITGFASLDSQGTTDANGYFRLVNSNTPGGTHSTTFSGAAQSFDCSATYTADCGTHTFEYHVMVDPFTYTGAGNIVSVRIFADANVATSSLNFSRGSSVIDPIISIDPVFAAAHPDYVLQINPLVGNVPEPASAWLLLAGLGLAGVRLRRGSRRA